MEREFHFLMGDKVSPFTCKMNDLNRSWDVTIVDLSIVNIRSQLEKEKQEYS